MMSWNLVDAQDRLSELIHLAFTEGPQKLRHQEEEVVVVSCLEYERLVEKRPSFKDYLRDGPSFEGLDLRRDPSPGRDVAL